MADTSTYYAKMNRERTQRLRGLMQELPPMCGDFFRGIEPSTSVLTRLNYAFDLRLFFSYLLEHELLFQGMQMSDITEADLAKITPLMLEMFLEHLNYYVGNGLERENRNEGKKRKLSTLKSFFKYMYRDERIPANVAELVAIPKIHEKPIIRLEPDEVARMLDAVDSGAVLTAKQQQYHEYTRLRDIAIFTVLLGTGIRISELVGLDIQNIDFNINSFLITRKGGSQVILYFGKEVEKALADYLVQRKEMIPAPGHENALFLSLQKKRINQRTIQKLVEKYAAVITPLKKISPHKFRSTFGTMLNHETGDIYLVADVLGNKDVNTTRKHYAAMSDDRRRMAASVVKLREDD